MADEDGGGQQCGDVAGAPGAGPAEQLRLRPDLARRLPQHRRLRALLAPAARQPAARARRVRHARRAEPLAPGVLLRPIRLRAQAQEAHGSTYR